MLNAVIAFEWELRDSVSNQLLAAGVRTGLGNIIKTEDQSVSLDSLQPAIDAWASDAAAAFSKLKAP